MLGALYYKVISKVPHIVRNPGFRSHQSLKEALIHLYKVSDDDRFDQLLNGVELGDRKSSELLSQIRLLNPSGNQHADLNKLQEKICLINCRRRSILF